MNGILRIVIIGFTFAISQGLWSQATITTELIEKANSTNQDINNVVKLLQASIENQESSVKYELTRESAIRLAHAIISDGYYETFITRLHQDRPNNGITVYSDVAAPAPAPATVTSVAWKSDDDSHMTWGYYATLLKGNSGDPLKWNIEEQHP